MKRLISVDVVRGLVMIFMVLDHVRDFYHQTSLTQSPTDLDTTSPALFFTRWVTHLCAPVFVFLAGTSAFFSTLKSPRVSFTRTFFLIRGAWLIILDLTLVNFGVWFDIKFHVILFAVLGAIGVGLIFLGLSRRLGSRVLGALGMLIILLHPFVVRVLPPANNEASSQILQVLFGPGLIPLGSGHLLMIGYPPIPWLGILLAGFGAGPLFLKESQPRRNGFLRLSIGLIVFFVASRLFNFYVDPIPWQHQNSGFYTVMSFLNVSKYPPSPAFVSLFLGIMFLLFYCLDGISNRFTRILRVYGRVPLFYFLSHWYVIHPLLFMILWLKGYTVNDFDFGFNFGRPANWSGLSLPAVYGIWVGTVILFYPLCRWYGRAKQKNHNSLIYKYL